VILRWGSYLCLATLVAALMTESVVLGISVACGLVGAYLLGAESSTSPPDAEDLKEWSS
jgi:hypothetical protein